MKECYKGETKKLGFGMMRLPKKEDIIDIEQTKEMVDLFLKEGFTYFDTAFVYNGSEEATRQALVERYPRDSYTLATKINSHMMAPDEEACKQQFYTSLERTGAGYFDYYLLHALMENNYKKYDEYHIWDFVKELKTKGLVKNVGFSFHAGPELLDQLLTEHPEVDFIQLQINYADWENPSVQSRANYEVARKHNVPIVVMEPVKGGNLANPPKDVQKLLKAQNPEASFASWAIRYVASLDGILTVLSGMSDMNQVKDNLSYMKEFTPLDEEEQRTIHKAQEIFNNAKTISCTACHYCTEGCPMEIPIPEIFAAMNQQLGEGQRIKALKAYQEVTEGKGKASACIACRQCEGACPQHLPIVNLLRTCKDELE